MKADMMSDEEERLSIISSKGGMVGTQPIDIVLSSHHSMMLPISRHPSCNNKSYMERNSVGNDSSMQRGSFYGRRDFENKHDDTTDIGVGSVNNNKLCRKPSTLDNVLTRIKSMRNSDVSDESDNDDDVYYDDDDDYNDDDDHEDS